MYSPSTCLPLLQALPGTTSAEAPLVESVLHRSFQNSTGAGSFEPTSLILEFLESSMVPSVCTGLPEPRSQETEMNFRFVENLEHSYKRTSASPIGYRPQLK
jgi:hypothetical protein